MNSMGGENENGSAGPLRSGPEWCAICNKPNADGECIGAGNGRGQRFAHVGCYRAAHPRLPAEPDPRDAKIAELEAKLARASRERDAKHDALTKISAIRDSIVGLQQVNMSEHIYPLVAALDGAGYVGVGYAIARENVGTLLEQLAAALAREERVKGALEMAESYLGCALAYHATPESCDCGRCAVLVAVRAARKEKA